MTYNNWVYIAVMAAVSYAIRVLPLQTHQKPVHPVLPLLCALCNAGRDDLPGHHQRHPEPHCRCSCAGSRHRRRMVRSQSVSGVRLLLCRGSCAGTVFGALSFLPLWFWVGHGGFLVFENFFGKLVTFRRFCRLMGEPVPKHTKKEGCAHGAPQF